MKSVLESILWMVIGLVCALAAFWCGAEVLSVL